MGRGRYACSPYTCHQADAQQIVSWVMSLANKTAAKKSLPQKGSVIPPAVTSGATSVFGMKPAPTLVLSASYTDKGGNNIKALTGSSSISRNSNTVSFTGSKNQMVLRLIKPEAIICYCFQP